MRIFLSSIIFSIFCFTSFNILANYQLAVKYFNKKQFKESILEFKKVIENSKLDKEKSDALFNLGVIYDNGLGTSVNKKKAKTYYELAAEENHKIAQYNLAWMYYNGESVEKNFFEAFKFYNLSAEQGYNKAQYNLASLYFYGDGTMKDYKLAYKWFKISSMNGINESKNFIKKIKPLMHNDEIIASENLVKNWITENTK